ncbi:hypothetical protein MPSEU_000010900 [Mayamaea pseudoterrestris]|nr:hypothetical protein MPSEU_000010900 [Mayamaea pseudoterrestris]
MSSASSDESDIDRKKRHDKKRRHDDESESSESSDDRRRSKKHKSSSRHKEEKDKKHRKKHKKNKRRKMYDSESDSESACSSSSESSRRRRRHDKRRKHDKKKKRKRSHERDDKDNDSDTSSTGKPSFGKYGILKSSDRQKMQRSFEMWAAQVKNVSGRTSTAEEAKLWEEYREDYNTATLPQKYYNYDKWEMEEYQKRQQAGGNGLDDDKQNKLDRQRKKSEAEKALMLATMNSSKIQDMRRQAGLRTQMQSAFKMGDMATYQKLKEKLEAE